jgi:hypothetical protein
VYKLSIGLVLNEGAFMIAIFAFFISISTPLVIKAIALKSKALSLLNLGDDLR